MKKGRKVKKKRKDALKIKTEKKYIKKGKTTWKKERNSEKSKQIVTKKVNENL